MKAKKLKKAIKDLWERIDWVQEAGSETNHRFDEVDRQIKMLKNNVFTDTGFSIAHQLERRIARLNESVEHLVKKCEVYDGWADRGDRLSGVENTVEELDSAILKRITAIEIRLAAYGVPEYGQIKIDSRLPEGHAVMGFESEDFSPPIGGIETCQAEREDQIVKDAVEKALENAEARIRAHLGRYDFDEILIGGVVEALRGSVKSATFKCCGVEFNNPHARAKHQSKEQCQF